MSDQQWKIEQYREAIEKLFKELSDPRDYADAAALLEWLQLAAISCANRRASRSVKDFSSFAENK